MKMTILGVIPARFGSTRLEGKVLADICGRPMLEWVYRRAKKARLLQRVIIACDHPKVKAAAEGFGAEVVLTSQGHRCGTERVVEVVRPLKDVDIVVNIQADEPLIRPQMIDRVAYVLSQDHSLVMATLKTQIRGIRQLYDPNVVKVVTDKDNFALYFSRSPLPYCKRAKDYRNPLFGHCYKHLGLYGYRRDFLLRFSSFKPSFLEKAERLEQLRVLENGYRIKALKTPFDSLGVDTGEDLKYARRVLKNKRL
ncbi:MAG: 3-deoxy-manno-octulosonate cytidylyltransferase [Candidatus Omnitrophota bacterium]